MISDEARRLGEAAAHRLAELNCCEIAPGLTNAEFDRIESEYGFEFADDHRAFLAVGLPIRKAPEEGETWPDPWPDWRDGDPDRLRYRLRWPVEELLCYVDSPRHWRPQWGAQPDDSTAAVEKARALLADVPQMVPLYAHRFLPADHGTAGHPVLSMWGPDIISYGVDLRHYIDQEFQQPRPDWPEDLTADVTVPFWRDYIGHYD